MNGINKGIRADHFIPAKRSDLILINEKKKSSRGFYKKLKSLTNTETSLVIPIVTGVLETVLKIVEKRLEELKIRERIETIKDKGLCFKSGYFEKTWRSEM